MRFIRTSLAGLLLLGACTHNRASGADAGRDCSDARTALGRLLEGPHACVTTADCAAVGVAPASAFQPAPADWRTRYPAAYEAFRSSCPAQFLSRYESPPHAVPKCSAGTCLVLVR